MFIYFWERDKVWVGEEQRERETQNLKQAAGSELSVQSRMQGSNSWTVRSWPELKLDAYRLSHPRAPSSCTFYAPGELVLSSPPIHEQMADGAN